MSQFLTHIGSLYVILFERVPYLNWFNPLITLYLNLRSFPFKQAWRIPVFVYGWPKLFSLQGSMICVGKCKTGMIRLNQTNPTMPNNPGASTAIFNRGKIIFHGKAVIYTANKISVWSNGMLELGEDVRIMCMCNVTAFSYIKIGNHTRMAHRSQILDANYHYIANFAKHCIPNHKGRIEIGAYCWICHSTTVAQGARIPDKTIVASNSLVNKDMLFIPPMSIIGGVPAKLITSGVRRVESIALEHKIRDYFSQYPDEMFYPLSEDEDPSICDID